MAMFVWNVKYHCFRNQSKYHLDNLDQCHNAGVDWFHASSTGHNGKIGVHDGMNEKVHANQPTSITGKLEHCIPSVD